VQWFKSFSAEQFLVLDNDEVRTLKAEALLGRIAAHVGLHLQLDKVPNFRSECEGLQHSGDARKHKHFHRHVYEKVRVQNATQRIGRHSNASQRKRPPPRVRARRLCARGLACAAAGAAECVCPLDCESPAQRLLPWLNATCIHLATGAPVRETTCRVGCTYAAAQFLSAIQPDAVRATATAQDQMAG
jgi:hypothetical protein